MFQWFARKSKRHDKDEHATANMPYASAPKIDDTFMPTQRSSVKHHIAHQPYSVGFEGSKNTQDHAELGLVELLDAAWSGHLRVVEDCLAAGVPVSAKDASGRAALSYAAENDRLEVLQKLIRFGAVVNARDSKGMTALSHAAGSGSADIVHELINHGAFVDLKDCDGRSALSHAARSGYLDVVQELISNGADADARDYGGSSALSLAARNQHRHVVAELLRASALDDESDFSSEVVDLFTAAAVGDAEAVQKLLAQGVSVDTRTKHGRTPLFYAAESGLTDIVRVLIENGASVGVKACSSLLSRESETPLTLAGRAGHMKTFQELIDAGAPVNVRSGEDGETPLISAARWDFFAGVHLLIARGGAFGYKDIPNDEHPLIPGTFDTMRSLCSSAFEFGPTCAHAVRRFQDVCAQLETNAAETQLQQQNTRVTFVSILFRFCRLLLNIEKRQSLLLRFIRSRAITDRIRDFHEELDHFIEMVGLEKNGEEWRGRWEDNLASLWLQFKELTRTVRVMVDGFVSDAQRREAAMLLQYELETCSEVDQSEMQDTVKSVLQRFLHASALRASPVVPEWFISRDDVEFHSWNLARSEGDVKFYEGKWRQTRVMIETSGLTMSQFSEAAARWYQLSHPNVVKLFGACHVGSPFVFVYEAMPKERQLQEFLMDNANRTSTWQRLYEAALGLQYLHSREVIHGTLRTENIIVGSDLVAKLTGLCGSWDQIGTGERSRLIWMAPELIRVLFDHPGKFPVSVASDIYAFGMCIWEAVTLEIPWKNHATYEIHASVSDGMFPERPTSIEDAHWDLISRMCSADASERVNITYVVNRLKQFVFDSEQLSKGVEKSILTAIGTTEEVRSESVDAHVFAELGDTIPNSLRMIQARCEKIPKDEWLVRSVYPVLEFIFALLQERHSAPTDIEAVRFSAVLSRVQRYLRTAVSEKSVYELLRSRKVAESYHVIYSELDRLLGMLDISETDPIRAWKFDAEDQQPEPETECSASSTSYLRQTANESSSAVTLNYFDSPSTNHKKWTWIGLAAASKTTHPAWFLSLQELMFSESEQLGQGAFGAVYKGSWLDTPVVIKFMGYEEDRGTISTDLLLHEVRVWHRLNHPHVLKLYGACHIDKRYFVCEFASNGDLTEFLKTPGNEHLKWQKMYEAALGLQYLHEQNIAHNDLKCDNIMVGMDGRAKLIDFGLSCLLNEAEIQIDVKKMGAVHWKSPEYLVGGRPSLASDVYSFAMCIIESLTGDIPWGRSMLPSMVCYRAKKGRLPALPESMNDKQRNLVQLMTKFDPLKRVKIAFVVDKLNEIAQDEKASQKP